MSGTLQMTMLYDFYGDLLTEKQREYFDLYHNEDLSLSEIAEKANITRQGVYDIITRAEKTLTQIEQKTGIIQKWLETRAILEKASASGEHLHPAIINYFQMENN
ncbi:MAG: YlxM family DNA-binding protein [Oscillospiraceae bacterium]|nr:YlxM family DNA-binding protein [Oscillospiraceae bacterium]